MISTTLLLMTFLDKMIYSLNILFEVVIFKYLNFELFKQRCMKKWPKWNL